MCVCVCVCVVEGASHSWESIPEEDDDEEEEEGIFQRMAGYMCKIKTDCQQVKQLASPGSGEEIAGKRRPCEREHENIVLSSFTQDVMSHGALTCISSS